LILDERVSSIFKDTFFFSSRRRHTRSKRDWSSDVCSSDLSTTLSATNGLLIRNRTAFEVTRNLTTVIFDKTGTLTEGSHEVQRVITLDNFSEDEIIQYAAAVQQNS